MKWKMLPKMEKFLAEGVRGQNLDLKGGGVWVKNLF